MQWNGGQPARARKIATIKADTFRDACIEFSKTQEAKGLGNFDELRLSFWCCDLFDNEDDAKKSFG